MHDRDPDHHTNPLLSGEWVLESIVDTRLNFEGFAALSNTQCITSRVAQGTNAVSVA